MKTLEGKWDCAQCRTIGIPGLVTRCPNCGDPRNEHLDPKEAPYLPDDARVITSADELAAAQAGPSWNCGTCGTENRGDVCVCENCQNPRDTDDMVAGVYTYLSGLDAEVKKLDSTDILVDDRTDAILQSADKLQPLADGPVSMPNRTFSMADLPRTGALAVRDGIRRSQTLVSQNLGSKALPVLIGGLVLLVVAGLSWFLYAMFFKTHDVTLTVRSTSWERQVEVEEYRTLTRTDWTVPSDGRIQSSHQAIHHYRKVFDRYEQRSRQVPVTTQTGTRSESYACGSTTTNNGNGTFSSRTTYCSRSVPVYSTTYKTEYYQVPIYHQEPVYATEYVYQVDRWVTDHFAKASGTVDPRWPVPSDLPKRQRVGDERKETYEVALADADGRKFERDLEYTQWSYLEVGETIAGKKNRQGSLRSVDWPSS